MVTSTDRMFASRWWYLVAAVVAAAYLVTVIPLIDSTPKYDDLNDVFGFFKQLALAQTPLQTATAFLYPNNEHITLFNHLLYATQFQLLGEIRFAPLVFAGHLIVMLTAVLLGSAIDRPFRPFSIAVMVLGYVTLHYWDSTFKAMTALSNQGVILFSIAALFALLRWRRLSAAIALAVLASFTQGNGLLVWPIGLGILLLDPVWTSRRSALPCWLLAATLTATLYAWAQQIHSTPLPETGQSLMQRWLAAPWLPLQAALAMLGSCGFNNSQIAAATLAGIGTLLACATGWPELRRQPLLMAVLAFLLLSAIMAGSLRGLAYGDVAAVLESRYRMYSVAFILLTGLLWLARKPSAALAAALVLAALALQASGFRTIPLVEQQAARFSQSYREWLVDGDFRHQANYFPPMSDHFLFVAEHLQLFDFSTLAEPGSWLLPQTLVPGSHCTSVTEPAGSCPLGLRHRGNAIAVALTVTEGTELQPLPVQLQLCDTAGALRSAWTVPAQTGLRRWYLPASAVPAGDYRAVITDGEQHCAQAFTRKPRKVEAEMQQLFGQ